MGSWGDEVVVVTGASRGLGLEVCRRLGRSGAAVGMIARDSVALGAAAASVGGRVAIAGADVTDAASLAHAIELLGSTLGAPTALVNNAGAGAWGALVDASIDSLRAQVELNYLGAARATSLVLPGMLRRGRGRIVNVGSIAGRLAAPFEGAYSASKFAVTGYTEALAAELDGTGASAAVVLLGPIDTEFFAHRGHPYELRRPRPMSVTTAARAVVRAVSGGPPQQFAPRWLRAAAAIAAVAPAAQRAGLRRMYAADRESLRRRIGDS